METVQRVLRAIVITIVTEYVRQRMNVQPSRLDSMNFLRAVELVPEMTVPEVERMSRVMIDISHGIHDFEGVTGNTGSPGQQVSLQEFMEEMEKRRSKTDGVTTGQYL